MIYNLWNYNPWNHTQIYGGTRLSHIIDSNIILGKINIEGLSNNCWVCIKPMES